MIVGGYTREEFADCALAPFPILEGIELSEVQKKAIRDAFADYLINKVEEENTKID